MSRKYLFIDRDGTLIKEPEDEQYDSLDKLELTDNVIPALLRLKSRGYAFVMVTNQDGLGTKSFPMKTFVKPQNKLLGILKSQGIEFEEILVCPHFEKDKCVCRKPKTALVKKYLNPCVMDYDNSYVIGDRKTDLELARNMGIKGIKIGKWDDVAARILGASRTAKVERKTGETAISVYINLDKKSGTKISTGIGFFDHMLEQLSKHAGFELVLKATGDLKVDEHHTVEDTGIAIGEALLKALGDKSGINRYGFLLPMDEAEAQVSIDLSGRSYLAFEANFTRDKVGDFPTEMVSHFFRSLSEALKATIHIKATGQNNHHIIEAVFKSFANALGQAVKQNTDGDIPSTKGIL
ncbi:MAG: bifunctional histidinol-phosphatase/imidazoleglycerol-phosphate dehydratase HisB [Oligoflexia bacterium]|nr:bifunctional histidinol-phosphatase/imidazoleglycerol-phosphate dehydratase HisB [Oligoflexia bacterium]